MSSENPKTNLDNLKIESIRKGTEKYRIKSYVIFFIVIAILLLFFVLLGSIGNDFFGILIFSAMMILPVLILFRNRLPSIIPTFLSNSIYEIDYRPDTGTTAYNVSQKNKEYGLIFAMIVLIIGSVVLIADYRRVVNFKGDLIDNLGDKASFFKIMGSVGLLIAAGIVLSNITNKELSLSSDEMDEDAVNAQKTGQEEDSAMFDQDGDYWDNKKRWGF